ESISLYWSLCKEGGISEGSSALQNIDSWFNMTDPQLPSPILTSSCLYYKPILDPEDLNNWLMLILSTPKQQEMAWKYVHHHQVLMDGTFSVCSSAILIFFLMAIDKYNIGILTATIIFTLKQDAKAAHASYDNAILKDVLACWKAGMGVHNSKTIQIGLGNTDNDKC
ncbi:hypothetical protein BDN71DRAFT_1384280, partial [Pleurotus eryngii]